MSLLLSELRRPGFSWKEWQRLKSIHVSQPGDRCSPNFDPSSCLHQVTSILHPYSISTYFNFVFGGFQKSWLSIKVEVVHIALCIIVIVGHKFYWLCINSKQANKACMRSNKNIIKILFLLNTIIVIITCIYTVTVVICT